MKKIIAIILWFLLVSLDSNSPQKISVSSEVENKVHNDVVAIQLSNKVKINRKHPYSKFCDNYHEIAMYYHLEHGIPTSVQLAQNHLKTMLYFLRNITNMLLVKIGSIGQIIVRVTDLVNIGNTLVWL